MMTLWLRFVRWTLSGSDYVVTTGADIDDIAQTTARHAEQRIVALLYAPKRPVSGKARLWLN